MWGGSLTANVRSVVEPVLGTQLDFQATVELRPQGRSGFRRAGSADRDLLRSQLVTVVSAEVDRLANIFSVYDPGSELRRWRKIAVAGSRHHLSEELTDLLKQSARWQIESAGAYNPAVGAAFEKWRDAEQTGVVPSEAQTTDWASAIEGVPYQFEGAEVLCEKDCTGLTFNSFAKGFIADRAAATVMQWSSEQVDHVTGAVVNLGGDIALLSYPMRVGVENPLRPYDNEPPLCVVSVSNGGVATSGASRRPIVIGGQPFSHLIDPRTCRPVQGGPASVTVIARSAAEADVVATVVAVTGQAPPGLAVAMVDQAGDLTTTVEFDQYLVAGSY